MMDAVRRAWFIGYDNHPSQYAIRQCNLAIRRRFKRSHGYLEIARDRARAESATLAGNAITFLYSRELKLFIERSPLPVLVRSCLEWLVDDQALETLFCQTTQRQYTRELIIDFIADTMPLASSFTVSSRPAPAASVSVVLPFASAWSIRMMDWSLTTPATAGMAVRQTMWHASIWARWARSITGSLR
jgi:hypothetical protein